MANNKFDFIISPVSPCGQFLTAEEAVAVFINAPDLLGGVCPNEPGVFCVADR